MKALLVPTEQHDLMTSTLETALLLARKFDSYIEGFALRPAIDNFAAMDPVSSMAMATVRQHDEDAAKQARGMFEGFMESRGVPRSDNSDAAPAFGGLDDCLLYK
jgi:hypothetical protein